MAAVDALSSSKVEEIKRIFNLFDFKKEGKLSIYKVEEMCKNLGAYVPSDEMSAFVEANTAANEITFDEFLGFFAKYYTRKLDKNELISAFEFLDTGKTGHYSADELKHCLMVIGDRLSEKEADNLLKGHADKSGQIDYRKFAKDIC